MAVSMREAGDFGIGLSTSEINIDYRAIAGRKDAVVAQLREGVAELLKGVEVISGEARFVSTCGVEVNGDIHTSYHYSHRFTSGFTAYSWSRTGYDE
jgi:pyruvate/2-oxoglutarate dehydrogenase complex dihydrolipoamide dehydrogenase (E3) component